MKKYQTKKMLCEEPNYSSCNYTSTKQCRYYSVCCEIIYHKLNCPGGSASFGGIHCLGWYKSGEDGEESYIEFADFVKLVHKHYPKCPFCGMKYFKSTSSRLGFSTPHETGQSGR